MTRLVLTGIMAFLLLAAPASAMELGMQQEPMTPTRCDQVASHTPWVRIMVQPERWTTDRPRYRATIQRCKALGLRVIVTLTNMYPAAPRLTAGQLAFSAAAISRDLGPWVDAWSPINEPNHGMFTVAFDPYCTTTIRTANVAAKKTVRYKRVRRGKYRRVRSHKTGKWRYIKTRGRRGHWRKIVRIKRTTTITTSVVRLRVDVCMAQAARRAYDAAAVQIRRYDPTAKLIFGDTAGPGGEFMRFMIGGHTPDADIVGIHYASPNNAVREVAARLKAPVWITEWGLTPSEQTKLAGSLNSFDAQGVALTVYYGALEADRKWRNQSLTPAGLLTLAR